MNLSWCILSVLSVISDKAYLKLKTVLKGTVFCFHML